MLKYSAVLRNAFVRPQTADFPADVLFVEVHSDVAERHVHPSLVRNLRMIQTLIVPDFLDRLTIENGDSVRVIVEVIQGDQ